MTNLIYLYINSSFAKIISWIFGTVVFIVGLLNLLLIHPVPAVAYFLLSTVYFPPINVLLSNRLGLSIPVLVKVILALIIISFTLGVSDLGDMID